MSFHALRTSSARPPRVPGSSMSGMQPFISSRARAEATHAVREADEAVKFPAVAVESAEPRWDDRMTVDRPVGGHMANVPRG